MGLKIHLASRLRSAKALLTSVGIETTASLFQPVVSPIPPQGRAEMKLALLEGSNLRLGLRVLGPAIFRSLWYFCRR